MTLTLDGPPPNCGCRGFTSFSITSNNPLEKIFILKNFSIFEISNEFLSDLLRLSGYTPQRTVKPFLTRFPKMGVVSGGH